MSRQRNFAKVSQTRDAFCGELGLVEDAAINALVSQLVEDAVRLLGPDCRDESVEVVARRIEMIFDDLVQRRARRNEALARLLRDRRLSHELRHAMKDRVFNRLVAAADTARAG
jgi:hypothetical protein